MDMNLDKLWEMVREREAWHAAVHWLTRSQTQLGDWTTAMTAIPQASQVALVVWNLPANTGDTRDEGLISGVGRPPWRRKWQVFLLGKSHGQRSLVGYNPCGHKESDTTECTLLYYYSITQLKLVLAAIRKVLCPPNIHMLKSYPQCDDTKKGSLWEEIRIRRSHESGTLMNGINALIKGLCPGGGHGKLLQYSCLKKSWTEESGGL